jgi:TP901 family phage tail tape measure protein
MANFAELVLKYRSEGHEKTLKEMDRTKASGAATEKSVDSMGRGFVRAGRQAVTAAPNIEGFNKSADRTKAIALAGAKAIAGMAVAFGAFATLSGAVTVIREFESSVSKMGAISGATATELAAMRDIAKDLGAATEFSAKQAADGLSFLAMAGFSAAESIAAIPAVLDLATASGLGLAQAADTASNIMSGFGIAATDAASVTDILAAASSRANTDVAQLGSAMSTVAPISAALDISLADTAAAIGVLSDAGIQGERAGTAMRGVLASLAGPSKQAEDVIKSLGLTIQDVDPATNSLSDVMGKLGAAGLSTADAMTVFGREAASGALVMIDGAKRLGEFGQELRSVDGAASDMADTMRDNLGGDIDTLQSSVSGLMLALGEAGLTAVMRGVIKTATLISSAISEFVSFIADAENALGGFFRSITGLTSAQDIAQKAVDNGTLAMGQQIEQIQILSRVTAEGSVISEEAARVRLAEAESLIQVLDATRQLNLEKFNEESGFDDALLEVQRLTEEVENLRSAKARAAEQGINLPGITQDTASWAAEIENAESLLAQAQSKVEAIKQVQRELNFLSSDEVAKREELVELVDRLEAGIVNVTNGQVYLNGELIEAVSLSDRLAISSGEVSFSGAAAEAQSLADWLGISLSRALALASITPTMVDEDAVMSQLVIPDAQAREGQRRAIENYESLVKSLNKVTKSSGGAGRAMQKLDREIQRLEFDADPVKKYKAELEHLDELLAAGLSDGAYQKAVKDLNDEFANSNPSISKVGDAIGDFVASGLRDFKSLLGAFKNMLFEMISTAVANPIKLALLGSVSGGGGIGGTAVQAATGGGGGGGGGGAGGLLGGIAGSVGTLASAAGAGFTSASYGFLSGGLSGGFGAIGAQVSAATAAGASAASAAAAIGAVAVPLLAVAAVFSFFKSKTKELDAGLRITSDSMGTFVEDFQKLEKKKFWGLSKKISENFTASEDAGPVIRAVDAIKTEADRLGGVLGLSADNFSSFSAQIKVSLKGLSEEQAQAEIQKAFGDISRQYAYAALGWFQENIGDVIREGQTADEALSELAGSLQGVNAVMGQLRLSTIEASVAGGVAARNFAELFGGLGALNQVATTYYQNFYSDAERLGHATELLADQMGELYLTVPATKDAFRALVEAADAAGDREMVASLLQISPLFAQVTDATTSAADAQGALTAALTAYEQAVGREIARLQSEAATALEPLLAGISEAETAANDTRSALDGAMSSMSSFAKAQIDAAEAAAEIAITPLRTELEGLEADAEAAAAGLENAMSALRDAVEIDIQSIADDLEAAVSALEATAQAALQTAENMRVTFEATFAAVLADLDAQSSAVSASFAAQIDLVSQAMSDATDSAAGLSDRLSKIESALSERGPTSEAAELLAYRQAQGQLQSFAGGASYGTADLDRVIATINQPTEKFFSNRFDYEMDFARTTAALRKLQETTGGGVSEAQQQIDLLREQITVLEGQRSDALAGIESQRAQAQALYDATMAVGAAQGVGNATLSGLQAAATAFLAAQAEAETIEADTKAEITALRSEADAQTYALEQILSTAQAQTDAALNTAEGVVSVEAAVSGLSTAVTGYTTAQDALSARQNDILAEIAAIEVARDAEVTALQSQLETAQALYDTATGQAATLTSIDAHMAEFNSALAEYTAAQVTLEDVSAMNQPLIDSINNSLALQTEMLEAQMEAYRDQISPVSDLPGAITALEAAIQSLASAQAAANVNSAPVDVLTQRLNGLYQDIFGRDVDAGGLAYYSAQMLGGRGLSDIEAELYRSPEYRAEVFRPELDAAYQTALGRMADQVGADYYYNQVMAGRSMDAIAAELASSPEALSIPSYDVGTNYHPGGLAKVHRDEIISLPRGAGVSTVNETRRMFDNSELIAEVRKLREMLKTAHNQAQIERSKVAQNTRKTADIQDVWDVDGLPAERTA